jgi:hypothetical protein
MEKFIRVTLTDPAARPRAAEVAAAVEPLAASLPRRPLFARLRLRPLT